MSLLADIADAIKKVEDRMDFIREMHNAEIDELRVKLKALEQAQKIATKEVESALSGLRSAGIECK